MVSILSKIKTGRAQARFQAALPPQAHQIAEVAARIRIRTARMNNVSWQDIIGKRSDLKLEIAKVLSSQDPAPLKGLIMIDKLSCSINESIELVERYCYDGNSPYLDGYYQIKYREVTIAGFEHLDRQYELNEKIICRRKGDKRNKDERPWGFYLRTAPFRLSPLSETAREIIFGAGSLGGGLAGLMLGYSLADNPQDGAIKGAVIGFFTGGAILSLLSVPFRITYKHFRFPMDYLNFKNASNTTDLNKLAKLIKSWNYDVRVAVAENQVIKDIIERVIALTDPKELTEFSQSPFPCIRGATAENPYSSPATLEDLLENDKFWLVRLAAAKNINASWENVADFLIKLEKAVYVEETSRREWDSAGTCGGLWTTIYETTEHSYYPEKTLELAHDILTIHHNSKKGILERLAKLNPELHEALTDPEGLS
jgi:hypothetical protein